MPQAIVDPAELRLDWTQPGAQLLHGPDRRSVPDLVSHLTGVQAQVPPAASLALRARRAGLTAAAVDRARTRDRSIVLCWAMRGTLHLILAGSETAAIARGVAAELGPLTNTQAKPEVGPFAPKQ